MPSPGHPTDYPSARAARRQPRMRHSASMEGREGVVFGDQAVMRDACERFFARRGIKPPQGEFAGGRL